MNEGTSIETISIVAAPGVGKTTVAAALGKELGIQQVIGTDQIREVLRLAFSPEQNPVLHTSAIKACNIAPEGENINTWGFEEQARIVSGGVEAWINRCLKEGIPVIIEGIHLIPGIVNMPNTKGKMFVLTLGDEEEHKRRIMGQGEDRATYKLDLFTKARAFQKFLVESAKNNGATVIENDNVDAVVQKMISYLH